MDDKELFELVRRNYYEANKEYIEEQMQIALQYCDNGGYAHDDKGTILPQ